MKILSYGGGTGIKWIRFFGHGFIVKNLKKHPMLFSERNGMQKQIIICKYLFRLLKPINKEVNYEK